jgi:hypothetical protein
MASSSEYDAGGSRRASWPVEGPDRNTLVMAYAKKTVGLRMKETTARNREKITCQVHERSECASVTNAG